MCPWGAHAARKARRIADNTLSALVYELLAAAQAVQLRGGRPSPVHQELINTDPRPRALPDPGQGTEAGHCGHERPGCGKTR
ncbi:MAG: hypothetical protein ACOX6Y_02435 [Christensenellales bacterium]